MTLQELFSDPSTFTKNVSAVNAKGEWVSANDPSAVSWCLMGGIRKATYLQSSYTKLMTYDKVAKTIRQLFPRFQDYPVTFIIADFNDNPETTFEDIRKVIETANV